MSDFDHHNQRWDNDISFTDRPPLGEILGSPSLSDEYGFTDHRRDDQFESSGTTYHNEKVNIKALWYFLIAEAVGFGLILYFTIIL